MKKIILALCLFAFIQTSQAQTKEETLAYINTITSKIKPVRTWKGTGCGEPLTKEEIYSNQQFTDKTFEYNYEVSTVGGCKPSSLQVHEKYTGINYKYLSTTINPVYISEIYSFLTVSFTTKFSSESTRYGITTSDSFQLFIPTDKVNNVKKALLHLRDLALKEKDLFDD